MSGVSVSKGNRASKVHRVTHVLTFNVTHFARFAGFGPGIIVVDPATI
jgi:hypothetical protein